MGYYYVKNWDRYQVDRKDQKSALPWFKVYNKLVQEPHFLSLSDSLRGQLLTVWCLAASEDGRVTDDLKILKRQGNFHKTPRVKELCEAGWLIWYQDGTNMVSQRRVEESRGEERRVEESKRENIVDSTTHPLPPVLEDLFFPREGKTG